MEEEKEEKEEEKEEVVVVEEVTDPGGGGSCFFACPSTPPPPPHAMTEGHCMGEEERGVLWRPATHSCTIETRTQKYSARGTFDSASIHSQHTHKMNLLQKQATHPPSPPSLLPSTPAQTPHNPTHITMRGGSATQSQRGALKEDAPGFNFDNYARNASLPTEKTLHLPSVRGGGRGEKGRRDGGREGRVNIAE